MIFEPVFRDRLAAGQDALIDQLAAREVAGFGAALGTDAAARLRLLLHSLDHVCAILARGEHMPRADRDCYVEAMVEELR